MDCLTTCGKLVTIKMCYLLLLKKFVDRSQQRFQMVNNLIEDGNLFLKNHLPFFSNTFSVLWHPLGIGSYENYFWCLVSFKGSPLGAKLQKVDFFSEDSNPVFIYVNGFFHQSRSNFTTSF